MSGDCNDVVVFLVLPSTFSGQHLCQRYDCNRAPGASCSCVRHYVAHRQSALRFTWEGVCGASKSVGIGELSSAFLARQSGVYDSGGRTCRRHGVSPASHGKHQAYVGVCHAAAVTQSAAAVVCRRHGGDGCWRRHDSTSQVISVGNRTELSDVLE